MSLAQKIFRRGSNSDGNIVALLSLKLLLLAFFILLSTISSFEEERTRAVMESVTTTFAGETPTPEFHQPTDAALGMLESATPALADQIESLFKATLPAVEMEQSSDGKVLRLEAPASSLFVVNSINLAPGRGVLIQRLANALTREDSTLEHFDLQFLHTVPERAGLASDSLPVLRTGIVVRSLEEQGLASADVATGLHPVGADEDGSERIIFEIRVHEAPVDHGEVEPREPQP